MSVSTSISDLPTDPVSNGNIGNITLNAAEQIMQSNTNTQQASSNLSLDQTTINQIVSGIQQASLNGLTQIHSRDMPMSTASITTDPQTQPNYIPPKQQNDQYIDTNVIDTSEMINSYNSNHNRRNSIDNIYDEIQLPLLLAVLYFFFQLPFLKKFLLSYFPVLFSNDGNFNVKGFGFTSVLFSLFFYFFNKIISYFGTF
jgi:hypothetical protein